MVQALVSVCGSSTEDIRPGDWGPQGALHGWTTGRNSTGVRISGAERKSGAMDALPVEFLLVLRLP